MTALVHAELLELRSTRTFAALVGTALALSLLVVILTASLTATSPKATCAACSQMAPPAR